MVDIPLLTVWDEGFLPFSQGGACAFSSQFLPKLELGTCSEITRPLFVGQAVPAGSHVRLNLQTGEREAKLPDSENGESDAREERRRKRYRHARHRVGWAVGFMPFIRGQVPWCTQLLSLPET